MRISSGAIRQPAAPANVAGVDIISEILPEDIDEDGGKVKQKYEQQMKKGVLEMLVLQLLSGEEKYGYQLICQLSEESGGMFLLKEGTLYPILYRLEEDGLVVSRWSEPKGREVSRKYYRITEEGRETLKQLRILWGRFTKNVDVILKNADAR